MNAIAYCRASTAEQETSVDVQRERIAAYATVRGFNLVDVISDQGVSSAIPLPKRPGGCKLFAALKTGGAQAIVILKLDRAFRNTVECLSTVESWQKKGLALHVVDLGGNSVDVTTATGKLTLTVLAAVSEMERTQLRERTAAALKHLRAQGKRTSGLIPMGYNLTADGKCLQANPQEQKTIQRIVTLHQHGESYSGIARRLNFEAIPTKTGSGRWHPKVVRGILQRELK